MNGSHDVGGVQNIGKIFREEDEPVFHSPWEGIVFAMMTVNLYRDLYNLDQHRKEIERMHPIEYFSARYYERWLHAMERNLVKHGVISDEELSSKISHYRASPDDPVPVREDPQLVEGLLRLIERGASRHIPVAQEPRFAVGDRVRARNINPWGHTRLPRYVRGKVGHVERCYLPFVFPDTNADRRGENPKYVYAVRFTTGELWGEAADPNEYVYVDLWESYLEPERG